jgi:hypothetical protein
MNSNWKQIAREHLAVLRLPVEREIEIVEELALHLEATYEEALSDGLSDAEAQARTLQSYDWRLLECELSRVEQPLAARALQPIIGIDRTQRRDANGIFHTGPALRRANAGEKPWFHLDCRAHAGVGHRRELRDI